MGQSIFLMAFDELTTFAVHLSPLYTNMQTELLPTCNWIYYFSW